MTSAAAPCCSGSTRRGDDERIRSFLAETLALWQVEGSVEAAAAPGVALIRTRDGRVVVRVERAAADSPFRWAVLVSDPVRDSAVPVRARPCASLVGLLNAIRRALGAERGSAIRVAPADP